MRHLREIFKPKKTDSSVPPSSSKEPGSMTAAQPATANGSAMSPAPHSSTSPAGAASAPASPSDEPNLMIVEQPSLSNGSAMSPAPQPSTSPTGAASAPPSPNDEPNLMIREQPSRSNGRALPPSEQPSTSGLSTGRVESSSNAPRIIIVEQPARYRRFRYPSEVDSAGSIRGENYTDEHKTFPTIRILHYIGPIIIVVFLVTKDSPGAYKVHPACLVGEGCRYNILTVETEVTEENCEFEFNNLRIQYVSSANVGAELKLRETLRVDPFRQGFGHKQLSKEDLHAVRLCFQAFTSGPSRALAPPVVSEVIYNSKYTGDLEIKEHCDFSGPTCGGTKIIFVSKQVSKDDIEVYFYQMQDGVKVWEAPATDVKVYDRTAISCRSPPYKDRIINNDVQVFYHLRRPSHNSTGPPAPFQYRPVPDDDEIIRAKKRKALHPIVQDYIDWQPPVVLPQDYALPVNQDWNMNGEPQPGPSRPSTSHSAAPANYVGVNNTPTLNRQDSLPTRLAQLQVQPGPQDILYVQQGGQSAQHDMQYVQQGAHSAQNDMQYVQPGAHSAQRGMEYVQAGAHSAQHDIPYLQQITHSAPPDMPYVQQVTHSAQHDMQFMQQGSHSAQHDMEYVRQEAQSAQPGTQFMQSAMQYVREESAQLGMQNLQPNLDCLPSIMPGINEHSAGASGEFNNLESLPDAQNNRNPTENEFDLFEFEQYFKKI